MNLDACLVVSLVGLAITILGLAFAGRNGEPRRTEPKTPKTPKAEEYGIVILTADEGFLDVSREGEGHE